MVPFKSTWISWRVIMNTSLILAVGWEITLRYMGWCTRFPPATELLPQAGWCKEKCSPFRISWWKQRWNWSPEKIYVWYTRYMCFPYKLLLQFLSIRYLFCFVKTGSSATIVWKGEVTSCVDGKQDVDGRRHSPSTFIIWISGFE